MKTAGGNVAVASAEFEETAAGKQFEDALAAEQAAACSQLLRACQLVEA